MNRLLLILLLPTLVGCAQSPGQRAVHGGLIGAGSGLAVGALAGGGKGALIGGPVGAVGGAAIGALTAPHAKITASSSGSGGSGWSSF
jgi:osmotically inducible lipoprotein OsmB